MPITTPQLRWNVTSSDNPPTHDWILFIVNRSDRIAKIMQKFREHAQPTDEEEVRLEGRIEGKDLIYRLITIQSYKVGPNNIDFNKVYDGELRRDRELYEGKSRSRLENYATNLVS